jgi:hypothetical protein
VASEGAFSVTEEGRKRPEAVFCWHVQRAALLQVSAAYFCCFYPLDQNPIQEWHDGLRDRTSDQSPGSKSMHLDVANCESLSHVGNRAETKEK